METFVLRRINGLAEITNHILGSWYRIIDKSHHAFNDYCENNKLNKEDIHCFIENRDGLHSWVYKDVNGVYIMTGSGSTFERIK